MGSTPWAVLVVPPDVDPEVIWVRDDGDPVPWDVMVAVAKLRRVFGEGVQVFTIPPECVESPLHATA